MKASKRVAIAVDVLQQIRRGKFLVQRGRYIDISGGATKDAGPKRELQKILQKEKSCQVCALGAVLASKALLFDQEPVRKSESTYDAVLRARHKVFGRKQADLMEYAFEGRNVHEGDSEDEQPDITEEEKTQALKFFGRYYGNDTARLRAIMVNVIENGGTFSADQD